MCFRSDKQTTMEVVPQSCAEVSHEVVAAHVVRAAKSIANGESLVKPYALSTDSGSQIGLCFGANLRRVHAVEIPKQRAEGITTLVVTLTGAPCDLAHHAKILME